MLSSCIPGSALDRVVLRMLVCLYSVIDRTGRPGDRATEQAQYLRGVYMIVLLVSRKGNQADTNDKTSC